VPLNRKSHHDRPLSDRRKLGAYYTPAKLSQILVDWAICTPNDTLLEPSFGGCGFLEAARMRFGELGANSLRDQIYGADIDPLAFNFLAEVLGAPVDLDRFIQCDFLELEKPKNWPTGFTAVVGNPPYVSFQEIDSEKRRIFTSKAWPVDNIGGRASLWAYFLAHSLSFLHTGGRMAWVLPGAFLQADYAQTLRSHLAEHFTRVGAFLLAERIFLSEGADEETVILLCDGFNQPGAKQDVQLFRADSVSSLRQTILEWDAAVVAGVCGWHTSAHLCLTQECLQTLFEIGQNEFAQTFGDIAKVQIGLVTGDNAFFILSRTQLADEGLQERDCRKILTKFNAARGISFLERDHETYVAEGFKGFLVDSESSLKNKRLLGYFDRYDKERRATVSTFKKRPIWSAPDDQKIPDAFFAVMSQYGPRMALNPDRMTCTNTVHRVYFENSLKPHQRKLSAISLLTSFAQLSAELVGRRYGSGVLKLEPRDAEKISLLLPKMPARAVRCAYAKIDRRLRRGELAAASQIADELIYTAAGLEDWRYLSEILNAEISRVRRNRTPDRKARNRQQ
jgi:adenine-specific DNA-methyltransferase